jgi:hypothetical protein
VGDVNGDGLGDIAAIARKGDGPSVFLGDGLGHWTEASEGLKYPRGFSCGIGTRLADLDRDGHLDLVVADHCRGLKVYRGSGGASWTEASEGIPTNLQGFNDADVGDLNGDGIPDIVAVSAFSRGFLVLGGRADRTWAVLSETGLPDTGLGFELRLLDANGDGRLDVVSTFNPVSTERGGEIPPPAKVWIQDEEGRFHPAQGFPDEGRFFGLATVPRTESGRHGLVFALIGARAGLYLFEPTSDDTWTEAARLDEGWFGPSSDGFIGVDTADFDGDGCADIVATGGPGAAVWLAMGDCRGEWRVCPEQTLLLDEPRKVGWSVTAGDLNGDGRLDVVGAFGTSGKGGLKAWIQGGP